MSIPRQQDDIIKRIEALAGELGIPEPLTYHMIRASGRDPRPMESRLRALVADIAFRAIDNDGDPLPTESEWEEIYTEVLGSELYRQARIGQKESAESMNKIYDTIYAKRIEKNIGISQPVESQPLPEPSIDTIMAVKRIIENEY